MNKFFEERKVRYNTHQTHIEDLVLLGDDGLIELEEDLNGMLNISDTDDFNASVKIDGAPAVVIYNSIDGYPGESGISLKSFLTSNKNCITSEEEIESKYPESDRYNFKKMLKNCLEISKYIPKGEAWQGDCLYTDESLFKTSEIGDGITYIAFQPNKVIYLVEYYSKEGKKIRNSKFGISFHTKYILNKSNSSFVQSFNVDASILNLPSEYYILDNKLSKDKFGGTSSEKIKSLYDEAINNIHKLKGNEDYNDFCEEYFIIDNIFSVVENNHIADQKNVNIKKKEFFNELLARVSSQLEKEILKLKTEKAIIAKKEKYKELTDKIFIYEQTIYDIIDTINSVINFKNEYINNTNISSDVYKTYFNSQTKGFIQSKGEGISLYNNSGDIVKLVDRTNFSSANRDPDILSGFKHEDISRLLDIRNKLLEAIDSMDKKKRKKYIIRDKAAEILNKNFEASDIKDKSSNSRIKYGISLRDIKESFRVWGMNEDEFKAFISQVLIELDNEPFSDDKFLVYGRLAGASSKYKSYPVKIEDEEYFICFASAGEKGVLNGKDLSPEKLRLPVGQSLTFNELLSNVKDSIISNRKFEEEDTEEIQSFLIDLLDILDIEVPESDKLEVINSLEDLNIDDFNVYINIPNELQQAFTNNIKIADRKIIIKDFGEVLGALILSKFFDCKSEFPIKSNEPLIDFSLVYDDKSLEKGLVIPISVKMSPRLGKSGEPSSQEVFTTAYSFYKNKGEQPPEILSLLYTATSKSVFSQDIYLIKYTDFIINTFKRVAEKYGLQDVFRDDNISQKDFNRICIESFNPEFQKRDFIRDLYQEFTNLGIYSMSYDKINSKVDFYESSEYMQDIVDYNRPYFGNLIIYILLDAFVRYTNSDKEKSAIISNAISMSVGSLRQIYTDINNNKVNFNIKSGGQHKWKIALGGIGVKLLTNSKLSIKIDD